MTDAAPALPDRIAGGLVGLLVGDALGVPYEFHPPAAIPAAGQIEFEPPAGFARAHAGTPAGTWSDDGAQALCLLASLLHRGQFDPEDFGRRLLNWYDWGYLAVDGRVFDIGITTGRALTALRNGVAAMDAGPADTGSNGNGALMRVLPLALWHRGSDAELVRDAQLQSCVTHGHLRSQVCCALYCLWARHELAGSSTAWTDAVASLRALYVTSPAEQEELEWSIRPDQMPDGRGGGYVVDCLRSALQVQSAGSFEAVVRAAVALGHDTDTTACVAGGIAGMRCGIAGIPAHWRAALRGADLYQPLLAELLALRASPGSAVLT